MPKRKSTPKVEPEPEFTYEQVAQAMNVCVTHLHRAAHDGDLVVQRYGPKCVRILKSDLEAYRLKHRSAAPVEEAK
jgi:excisionase family DNA binding protein